MSTENYQSSEMNELAVTIFKAYCTQHNINIKYEKLDDREIPPNIPKRMRQFYQLMAPVSIKIDKLGIELVPYHVAFGVMQDPQNFNIIPIARFNGENDQMAYIDKYDYGAWDYRIQLPVGNGKIRILGTDIFDFLVNICQWADQE